MRLIAAPGVGLAPLRGRLDFPRHSLTLIAKVKLALTPSGRAHVLSREASFPSGDEPYPEDAFGAGAPRYASDFVHHKPCADVLLVGHFHAPNQKPVRASHVALSINGRMTRLNVIGRRRFMGGALLPTAREAEPFSQLALRWEWAYGGAGHLQNPLGTGYLSGDARGEQRDFAREPLELPRIEQPERPFVRLDQPLEPVCFAPRPASWPVRRAHFGTCDARWLETRWPWFPADLDPRYFLSAPPALQQRGYLRGDERLCFENMHAQIARYQTQLPGLSAVGMVTRERAGNAGERRSEAVSLALDTLWVDMDQQVAQLVWRGALPCRDAAASDLLHAFVDLVPAELTLSPEQICARGERAIAEDEACWVSAGEQAPAVEPERKAADGSSPWTLERVREMRAKPGALRGANLSDLDLSGEDLSRLDLRDVVLQRTMLKDTQLEGALLSGAQLSDLQIDSCRLDHACFDGARLERVRVNGCSATDSRFVRAQLVEVTFSACQLHESDFEHARLERVRFDQCKLDDATFEEIDAQELVLDASSVARLRAAGARMPGARWLDLTGADLSCESARLSGAHLLRCQLPGADFSGVDLSAGALRGCMLAGAKFARADLSHALLLGCDCFEATFEQARLVQLDGSGSSFFRAEFLAALVTGFHGAQRDLTASKLAQTIAQG